MSSARLVGSAVIAGVIAALCTWAGVVGAVLSLVAGSLALVVLSRRSNPAPSPGRPPELRRFAPWYLGTGLFAAFVVSLAPFADLVAVSLALLLFSPLFGTTVYAIESAVAGLTRYRPMQDGSG
jgi:CDP-diglyceride synthetase